MNCEFKDAFVGSSKTPCGLKCGEDISASSIQQNHITSDVTRGHPSSAVCQQLHDVCGHGSLLSSPFDHELGQVVDNSQSVVNKMASLCENEDLSDVELVLCSNDGSSSGRVFAAHKLVLCCSSDVFRVMLTNRCWQDSSRRQIELHEDPHCIEVFGDLLHYIYSGRILLTHDSVLHVLMLADKYNIVDLQDVCCCYMCAHLVSTRQHNRAVSWLQYSLATGHHNVTNACRQFTLWNFHKVASSPDFLTMEEDILAGMIRQSELVIPDELTLFQCVSLWIRHRQSQWPVEDRHEMVLEILTNIRFAMIPPSMLGLVTADPIFADYADFFEDQIAACLQFHSPDTWHNTVLPCSTAFEPRNYTNELWGTVLSVDPFSSFAVHDVMPVFFSTPASAAAIDSSDAPLWEWSAELFPKGVQFSKFVMIGLWRNLEVSGTVYDTVRLVLSAKSCERRNSSISVLVFGVQDGVEYIRHVVERHFVFDSEEQHCQINDIVPYNELNCANSPYLCGTNGNAFKIMIVIKPFYCGSS